MWLWSAAFMLLGACSSTGIPPRAPSSPPSTVPAGIATGCGSDADCLVIQWAGCCTHSCPEDLKAVSKAALKRQQDRCAIMDCDMSGERACLGMAQPLIRAVCVDNTCVGVLPH